MLHLKSDISNALREINRISSATNNYPCAILS